MNTSIEYGLHGAFKVDLFSGSSREMYSTTDWFDNFITPTGLMFPLTYAFADCFRYLSLGRSSTAHSGGIGLTGFGTTGLSNPVASYTCSDSSTQVGQYIDWRGYQTGLNVASNCGTIMTERGVRFFRAWQIPTGATEIFMNEPAGGGLTISEFMVSPSSGEDAVGKYAFSRVLRNLYIPNGFRAIVSYQLRIDIANTGVTGFGRGTFNTGNADVENDLEIIRAWNNLSGYYKQVYHGLRQVDNLGITYVPSLGDGMEPASRNIAKTIWYLSPDNGQFDVNATGGGAQTNITNAYAADGLMRSIRQFDLDNVKAYSEANDSNYQTYYNNNNPAISDVPDIDENDNINISIRVGRNSVGFRTAELGSYKINEETSTSFTYQVAQDVSARKISYATPGAKGFDTNIADFGKKAVFSTSTSQLPFTYTGQNTVSGRKKTITRRSLFSPVSSLGYNTRFASLVYAYQASMSSDGSSVYYPLIDCLFLDSSGRALMPHYRFITGIAFADRGTGIIGYHFRLSGQDMSSINKFTMRSGFFGPYQSTLSHGLMTTLVSQNGGDNFAGLSGSGALNAGTSGYTGSTSIKLFDGSTFVSPWGWGAVYGAVVDSGFFDYRPDLGLHDHSTGVLRVTDTGKLYWPMVFSGNELSFGYTGLKYFDPALGSGFADTGWFGRKQVIKNIEFEMVDPNNGYIVNTIDGFTKNITGVTGALYSGYYLTNRPYSGERITGAWLINNSAVSLTGYIIPRSITPGKLFGTVWNDAGNIPLVSMSFLPKHEAGAAGARRVYQFFTGITDRGYPNGTGAPFFDGDLINVFFTGVSGASGVYLTHISGISPNAVGQSYLSGTVNLTNFAPPIVRPLHSESFGSTGWRLATNFAPANYYGSDIYTATAGGEYPALSFDNGLEMYLDLQWSSPCGPNVTALTCNEPV